MDSPLVDTIVARWYDGSEPYATSRGIPSGLSNPILSTINGRIHTAYLSATQGRNTAGQYLRAGRGGLPYGCCSGGTTMCRPMWKCPWNWCTTTKTGLSLTGGKSHSRRMPDTTAAYGPGGLRVGQSPDNPWAIGRYGIQVYNEGRKLAEFEYEVTE